MLQHFYHTALYAFSLLSLQTLVVALVVIAVGVWGLIREQGSPVSIVYFVLTLGMGVWLFGFSWMYIAHDETLALWWAKVAYVGIAFIPAAVYHFGVLLTQEYEEVRERILGSWILSGLFMTIILTTDIQFGALKRHSWGYYPQSRITSLPFIFFFIVVMFATLRRFVRGYRRSTAGSALRRRTRTLVLAHCVTYLASLDYLASFGLPWYPVGYIAIFAFAVISLRSISRYRFMVITPAFAARQIINTMNDALIVFDPDGIVKLVNQATCGLFGYAEGDLVGKRLARSMEGNGALAGHMESLIAGGPIRNRELTARLRGSDVRTLSLSTSTMLNPAGEPLASVCVVSDVTDRKHVEEEREQLIAQLQEANGRLQAADKMKSEFVSVVSHELRSPLTTIKSFVELILMKPQMPSEKRDEFMQRINDATDRLHRLVNDLLDLARIEAGSMTWRKENLSMEDVLAESVAGMGPLFENKNLRLTTSIEAPLPRISGDRDRLVQVVINLLANAAKYTPAGGAVRVAARREPDPPRIVVEVADTGIGIAAEDIDLVFERFHRTGDQHAARIEGTGLGLSIARQIVEYHGGKIWATSTRGVGSTFIFTLPLAGADDRATQP